MWFDFEKQKKENIWTTSTCSINMCKCDIPCNVCIPISTFLLLTTIGCFFSLRLFNLVVNFSAYEKLLQLLHLGITVNSLTDHKMKKYEVQKTVSKSIINTKQIRALLWRDFLVRMRQPWLTLLQYAWPLFLFVAIYCFRLQFGYEFVEDCQFPTRPLPIKHQTLTFFQSYVCTVEDECLNATEYEETTNFENAPLTPLLHLMQTFVNEPLLMEAIVNLPHDRDILGAVAKIYSHEKFKDLQKISNGIVDKMPMLAEMVGIDIDMADLWSDDTFIKAGEIICDRAFTMRIQKTGWLHNFFPTDDDEFVNRDEIDSMPTPHCKELYVKTTSSADGRLFWGFLKPIIQGKIVYGPGNPLTDEIMSRATAMYEDVKKVQQFVGALNQLVILLRTDTEFQSIVLSFFETARSPFVQMLISGSIDIDSVEEFVKLLLLDDRLAKVIQMIVNFLECFSTDRLVRVTTEAEMERQAHELFEKKMFHSCVHFHNVSRVTDLDYSYTIRMDLDYVPPTVISWNPLYFPGPNPKYDRGVKYQRGFVQLQYSVDQAIIETIRHHETLRLNNEQAKLLAAQIIDLEKSIDTSFKPNDSTEPVVAAENTTTTFHALKSEADPNDNLITGEGIRSHFNDDGASIHDESERTIRRRRIALDLFLFEFDLLLGPKPQELHADQFEISTKQFPHPKNKEDLFVGGLYLIQVIQFTILQGLTFQLSVSLWLRISTKGSGNSTLMRVMGLRKSSEHLAFIITNIVELLLMFSLSGAMMYIAEIITVTDLAFLVFFLILFAICLTSYYYMVSTFFSNASIGLGFAFSLIYFMVIPYIVLVSHDTELTLLSKFLANLSFVSAFFSSWRQILFHERLQKSLSFDNAFSGAISENDLKLSLLMLVFDTVLYSVVGYLNERFSRSDFKFYKVPVKYMDASIGGFMRNVTKTFDGKTPVVNNVSITFRRDHVTCLLGHNGAGKTTIIKLLTGQLKQTSGEIYLPHNLNAMEYKETIGLCPQNNVFIPNLTAKELLELYASIKAPDRYSAVLEETIKSLDFGKHLHFKCENLSGGFKRRLNIAIAFIGSPNLVILDEPCAGVDNTGRKEIWRLIADLRKGRAVVLATHYLDEAERLGDNVLFLKDGEISSAYTSATMKHQLTKSFDIQIKLDPKANRRETIDEIETKLEAHAPNFSVSHPSDDDYHIDIPYCDATNKHIDFGPLIESIEKLHQLGAIQNFRVTSKDLSEVFRRQFTKAELQTIPENDQVTNGLESDKLLPPRTWDQFNFAKQLLWKRFTHFKRNYGLIALILIAPEIFESLAYSCMTYRMPSECDSDVVFSHQLYTNSTQFYTFENVNKFNNKSLAHLKCHDPCEYFNSSKDAFDWLLETHDEFIHRRYGGITLNDSKMVVWYNTKGYHAMPVYLNELSSALFKAEMDNDLYKITTSSYPMKFKRKDLTFVPLLQEFADFGLSVAWVIVFSFIATAPCVYVVNERVRGEKLQQRLCNVSHVTYWGVALLWDFSLYLITLLIAVGVLNLYDIPVFTARDNLYGVALLLFMFGFAMVPVVHLTEKLFYDASMTITYLLCLNLVTAFAPIVVIALFDVIGKSERSRTIRNFVKRVLLVLPQNALTDGLIELGKNHLSTGTFNRFDVYKYNSPITGTLLLPHTLSFLFVGVFCLILNYLVENGHMHRFTQRIRRCRVKLDDKYEDLLGEKRTSNFVLLRNVFLTAVANDPTTNEDKFDVRTRGNILVVEKLCKSYGSHRVLNNVSFNVAGSECFGLLGVNGAGKSTIFSILSGENYQSCGSFQLLQKKGISYCPQTNALDDFLTVEEVIHFYARLRKIANIEHLTTNALKSFHLEQYRNVLVKDLSGGNRRKLSVAIACFGDTQLVLLDEPTSDIDPITRTLVYGAIASLIAARRSVILTSHTISEIEQLCHRIGVMRAGKMISIDSPMALKRRFGQSYVVKAYYDPVEATTIERYVRVSLPGAEHLTVHNECLQFSIKVRTGQCDNSTDANAEGRILLSDLFGKLYNFTVERKIAYTISECLLDQIIQQVHEADDGISHSYSNPAFEVDETQFM